MVVVIEQPKDQFQNYGAWMPDQPAGIPVIGTGDSPEEALEDLRYTLQRWIDGYFDDEDQMMLADELLPQLYEEDFQVFVEPQIKLERPLVFNLDFDNYLNSAQ